MEEKKLINFNGNGHTGIPKMIREYLKSTTIEERKNIVFRPKSMLIDFDIIVELNDFGFMANDDLTFTYKGE